MIEEAETKARKMIDDNEELFENIAQSLLEFETLTGDELRALMEGKRPDRKDDDDADKPKISAVPKAGKSAPKKKKAMIWLAAMRSLNQKARYKIANIEEGSPLTGGPF